MKSKILFSVLFVLFILLYAQMSFSQTYNFILTNDTWDGHMVCTLDLYVQSTNAGPLEFATASIGLRFPDAMRNGGTITASIVAGSSELTNTTQIPTAANAAATSVVGGVTMRIIKVAGKTPPSAGNGSMLTTGTGATGPGTRLFTLKLTNTVDWVITGNNSIDTTSGTTGYAESMNCYIGGINVNIISGMTLVKILTTALLPVELTSFVSNVSGRQVNLNWETKTEANSNMYEIERAIVGAKDATITWATIGTVKAAGTSTTTSKYSYTDKNLQAGKYQYRLKIIDNDGSYKLSDVIETEITLPKNFELSQNYPNPFNPSTKINYSLPFDAKVTLEVYNITGERIGQIVNQEQSAGYYTVNFSSSALNRSIASGVYLYKINAVNNATGNVFTSIKKMMLLK